MLQYNEIELFFDIAKDLTNSKGTPRGSCIYNTDDENIFPYHLLNVNFLQQILNTNICKKKCPFSINIPTYCDAFLRRYQTIAVRAYKLLPAAENTE